MEIIYFISFIVACSFLLMWATGKSKKRKNTKQGLKRKPRVNKEQSDRLTAPSNYLLANRDDLWQKRREHAADDVIATNRFVPKSVSAGETEYDGFSRRDRHHVVVGTAHIKKEDHIDEPAIKSSDYEKGKAAG